MYEEVGTYSEVPSPFLVYLDAASLKYIVNLKSEETIFQHWYAELAQFEFIVIHKKGSENVNADALSRAKHLDEPTADENEEYQGANEVGVMKITFASELEGNPVEIGKERRISGYPPAIHNLSNETKFELIEGNVLRKLQEEDEVWQEVIKWIVDGKVPKMQEVRGGIQELISVRQIFNPTLFVMYNGILCYNRHTDPAKPYDALCVCVPAVKLKEVFKISHEGLAGGHRGVAGMLDKFQRTFFVMSAREKIRRLVNWCNLPS